MHIRALAAAVSAGVVVGAVVGAVAVARAGMWFGLPFEVMSFFAGVLGALLGFGFFARGPAVGLACVGGTVFVCAVLGFQGAGGTVRLGSLVPGAIPSWLFLARVAAAGACLLLAALVILRRNPRVSLRRLGLALGLGTPPLLFVGALAASAPARGVFTGLNPVLLTVLAVAGFFVFTGLVSAAFHLALGAFTAGLDTGLDEGSGAGDAQGA